jgi:hypothetical protein
MSGNLEGDKFRKGIQDYWVVDTRGQQDAMMVNLSANKNVHV